MMSLSTSRPLRAVLALCLSFAAWSASAQPDNQPGATTPAAPEPPASAASAAGAEDVRNALKKQEGDVDQSKILKDTLTKVERQYSLLKQGRVATNYNLNYSYIGTEAINTNLDQSGSIDLFKVENTRSHTVTNSFEVDYGLLDNVTLTATLPFVDRFTQSDTFSGNENGIGDLSFGARFQPFEQTRSGPSLTFTSSLSLPTGRSPFRTLQGSNLATGAGYATASLGLNASQVLDPVAVFTSLGLNLGADATGLHQQVGTTTLNKVHPGVGLAFGAGFTYALSYDISTTVSFQENVTTASRITYTDGNGNGASRTTAQQVAALLNFGLGVRLNPKTTISLSSGIGLTTDSPDFTLSLNVPLSFSFF